MKKLLFAIAFLASVNLVEAQNQIDSIAITEVNDTTFLYETFQLNEDGFITLIERSLLDSSQYVEVLYGNVKRFDKTLKGLEEVTERYLGNFNKSKTTLNAIEGVNYVSLLTEEREGGLLPFRKLQVGDTTYDVDITLNNNRISDGSNIMKYRFKRLHILELLVAGANTPFFSGTVELYRKQNQRGRTIWKGKNEANEVVILK